MSQSPPPRQEEPNLLDLYLRNILRPGAPHAEIWRDSRGQQATLGVREPQVQGQIGVQLFDSGILASRVVCAIHVPVTATFDQAREFVPSLALTMKWRGAVELTSLDRHTQRFSGRNELWLQSQQMAWRRSTILPGELTSFHVSMQEAVIEHWIDDDALQDETRRQLSQYLRSDNPGSRSVCVTTLPASMLTLQEQAMSLLATMGNQHPLALPDRLRLEGLVLALLGTWLALPPEPRTLRQARWRRAVDEAIEIARSEYDADLSIDTLARRVGTNACYLKRGFQERTGMGVAAFVRQQRMKVALALLEEGQWSIKDVAHYVGYRSLGHFSQAFRAVHGHLPSEVQTEARTRTGRTEPGGKPSPEEA